MDSLWTHHEAARNEVAVNEAVRANSAIIAHKIFLSKAKVCDYKDIEYFFPRLFLLLPFAPKMFRRGRNSTNARRQPSTGGSAAVSSISNARPASQDGKGSTITETDYARKCRELMELYRALLALG